MDARAPNFLTPLVLIHDHLRQMRLARLGFIAASIASTTPSATALFGAKRQFHATASSLSTMPSSLFEFTVKDAQVRVEGCGEGERVRGRRGGWGLI